MAEKTTISSTDLYSAQEISKIYSSLFLKSGDFYKFTKNIKKHGYTQKDVFLKYFSKKSEKLTQQLKKSYEGTIDLINNYYENNPQLISSQTLINELQPNSIISKFQICSIANNFSIYSGGGINMSLDKSVAFCIAQKAKINRYNIEDFEGWSEDEKFYKYNCQLSHIKKTNKILITPKNQRIVDDKLDVALFEEQKTPYYKFLGLFKANKIFLDSTKPYFKLIPKNVDALFNEDLEDVAEITQEYVEGAKIQYKGIRYERNQKARLKCIEVNGTTCKICGFNFERVYGPQAKDYIHVHHIIPLNKRTKPYELNPVDDLIPVCPNCHAMLHKFDCAPEAIKSKINANKKPD